MLTQLPKKPRPYQRLVGIGISRTWQYVACDGTETDPDAKFIILHEHKHEDGIRNFLMDVWELWVKVGSRTHSAHLDHHEPVPGPQRPHPFPRIRRAPPSGRAQAPVALVSELVPTMLRLGLVRGMRVHAHAREMLRAATPRAVAANGMHMSAVARWATPTNSPPSPAYTIFDRDAKERQRTRAALRAPIDEHGQRDESRRGEPSRQTDYVRDMGAESLAERLLVRASTDAGH